MRRNKSCAALLGVSVAVTLAAGTPASAAPTVVSGPSPFAGCTIGGSSSSVVFVNAEVEPWLAVNPKNTSNLIGAWQQDRWSNGGAHGLVAGFSFDGGHTWGQTSLPFSACANGLGYERASDPWVSIGPDGTAYAVSISFNQSNNNNAVAAAVSSDGGQTWGNLSVIVANNEPTLQFFNDKESVTANPVKAGVAYAVWDRLELPNGNPYANLHTAAYRGPTLFSKTVDGGKTWSSPAEIVKVPARQQTIGNQIVVNQQDGTLYNFFNLITPPFNKGAGRVAFIKSTDDGVTWTTPQVIATLQTVSVFDPNTGTPVRTGDIIPEPAIDPATGQLYVAWQDSRFNGGQFDEIALSTSADGGKTWSAPIRVNTSSGRPAFNPSVRVNSAGTVAVTYYDFRTLKSTDTTLPTDYWRTTSPRGGQNFGNELHIAGSFDMKTAPYAEGYFIGDYQGLGATDTEFVPFFVQTTGNATNPTDVFVAPAP